MQAALARAVVIVQPGRVERAQPEARGRHPARRRSAHPRSPAELRFLGRRRAGLPGGISYGEMPAQTTSGPRPTDAAGDEGETESKKARARGTDFLGLVEEEESA